MRNRGPSPLVPSLMVGVLGLVVFGPTLLSLTEYFLPLFQAGEDSEGGGTFSIVMVLLLLSLLLLIHLLSLFFPTLRLSSFSAVQQSSSSGFDAGGFGLGSVLLIVLFFVLYNLV